MTTYRIASIASCSLPVIPYFSQFDFRSALGSCMLCFDSARKHTEYVSQLDSARLLLQMGDSNQGGRVRLKTSVRDLAFVLVMSCGFMWK